MLHNNRTIALPCGILIMPTVQPAIKSPATYFFLYLGSHERTGKNPMTNAQNLQFDTKKRHDL